MNARGFTLVESLVALSILGIALAGILPSMVTFVDSNTLTEVRSDAVVAGQQAMEALRQQNPETMPESGGSDPVQIQIGPREYSITQIYCARSEYCGPSSRHVIVEVRYGGEPIYSLESVFTRLR